MDKQRRAKSISTTLYVSFTDGVGSTTSLFIWHRDRQISHIEVPRTCLKMSIVAYLFIRTPFLEGRCKCIGVREREYPKNHIRQMKPQTRVLKCLRCLTCTGELLVYYYCHVHLHTHTRKSDRQNFWECFQMLLGKLLLGHQMLQRRL
jgi:hypothetical protein